MLPPSKTRFNASYWATPLFLLLFLAMLHAALPNSRSAEKARVVARDVIEYLDSIDYNKYFESLEKPQARSGERQKMFLDFSLNSVRAAQVQPTLDKRDGLGSKSPVYLEVPLITVYWIV